MLRLAVISVGVALSCLVCAAPASAHAILLKTNPGSGSIIQRAPSQITLKFNEPVKLVASDIGVVAPNGKRVSGTPERTGDGSTVTIPVHSGLPHGTFLVSYRIISADSHPVAGGFSFSLGAPSKTAPAATGGASATEQPVVSVAMPIARYLGYAGLVLLVGPALVLMSLWPARLSRRGPARLIRLGLVLTGLATVAEFYLQVPYSAGTGVLQVSWHGLAATLSSRFGWAHLVRGVLLVAAVPLLAVLSAERRNRLAIGERIVLGLLAVVTLGTWGFGGHPGTSPVPWLTVLADTVHLTSMAVWLGGLAMLVGFLLRRARDSELAAVLPVWSRWATLAVAALAAAGVLQACLQLGSVSALTGTTYGKLIIVKVVAFAGILVVASLSRSGVRRIGAPAPAARAPAAMRAGDTDATSGSDFTDAVWDEVYASREASAAVEAADDTDVDADTAEDGAAGDGDCGDAGSDDDADGARSAGAPGPTQPVRRRELRRLVLIELVVAVLVLGVTAVLVQTTPARSARSVATRSTDLPFNKTFNTAQFSLQVELDPAHTGRNTVHAIAFHRGNGRPQKVRGWRATASLRTGGIGPIEVPLKPITDNHAIGDVALPKTGTWKFTFTIRTSPIDEETVTASIPVH